MTATSLTNQPQQSDSNSTFIFKKSQTIKSLNVCIEEYQHENTGALHYHISSENDENVFLVGLRTVPVDSTGVAHILEHTALCGSKRFPVRDPFFMMIRRSLNTFMNAFTSSDWTAYPFASKNRKDFNNLMDVYLDAVFFSRLHELDFAQEGHRVEFERPEDATTPLVYKGVVFNEMKGAMSSPTSILWQTLSKHMFPSTTYHFNSGGEPENIPDLSYEQLKAFYKIHYHPSNATFMTFGNIPAIEHQAVFEEKVLSHFKKLDINIHVNNETRFLSPISVVEPYAIDKEEKSENKTHIVLSWLFHDSTNLDEQLKSNLLSDALLGDSASPLRLALETTDLGMAPSPMCGLEDSNKEMTFMCGVEGAHPDQAKAVEALILKVLRQVANEGIPYDRMEAVLHQLELSQREVGGDGFPYGLQLILAGLPCAIHRGDPCAMLNLDPALEKLHEDIKNPDFIKTLVKTYLLENNHRVTLTLVPDNHLAEENDRKETQRLAALKETLSEKDRQNVISLSKKLADRQNQIDDPSVLPKVDVTDIPARINIAKGEQSKVGTIPATFFNQGTNGITYQQIIADIPQLDDHLIEKLGLFSSCFTEIGCADKNYQQVQSWQSSISGGINAHCSFRNKIDDIQKTRGVFILSSKALTRNHAAMSNLLKETFYHVKFNEHQRIKELVSQEKAHKEQSITGQGHILAMAAASSKMSPRAALAHQTSGLLGIQKIKQLDSQIIESKALDQLMDDFKNIHQAIIHTPLQILSVAEAHEQKQIRDDLLSLWNNANIESNLGTHKLEEIRNQTHQLWITNTQVNFCAKAYKAVPYNHADAPVLDILATFLRNGFLHRAIREQGGAYGGGANYSADHAVFRFFSYRDPRLTETLNDFDRAITWLLESKHEDRQLEEAIFGVIGGMDKPGSPAGEAKDAFYQSLSGKTPEIRQQYRERVLETTINDLKRVGETYLSNVKHSTAVITNSNTLEQNGDLELTVFRL